MTSALDGERPASRSGRFTPGDKSPWYPLYRRLGGPRTGLDDVKKRTFLTIPGLELRPLGRPPRSLSLYWPKETVFKTKYLSVKLRNFKTLHTAPRPLQRAGLLAIEKSRGMQRCPWTPKRPSLPDKSDDVTATRQSAAINTRRSGTGPSEKTQETAMGTGNKEGTTGSWRRMAYKMLILPTYGNKAANTDLF
jgi:hypothetical protein